MKSKFMLLVLSGSILLSSSQTRATKSEDAACSLIAAGLVALVAVAAACKIYMIKSSHANVYLVDSDDTENRTFLGTIELECMLPTGEVFLNPYTPKREVERLKNENRERIKIVADKAMSVYLNNSGRRPRNITGIATEIRIFQPFSPDNVLLGTGDYLEKKGYEILARPILVRRVSRQDHNA